VKRLPIVIALVSIVLVGCARATADAPAPSVPPTPSAAPTVPATPEPTAEPSAPPATPAPTATPLPITQIDVPSVARVTADGVAVRVLPGTDQPLIVGYDYPGEVPEVRLAEGDRVGVIWGPVVTEGHTWYAVRSHDTGTLTWPEGWMSASFLSVDEPISHYPSVASMDGFGSGDAETAVVPDHAGLYVNAVAAPMPDGDTCEIEVLLVGTDGETITIGSGQIDAVTSFFASPLENAALSQQAGGSVTFEVRSDCSWAGTVTNPQG
jgi:hypothetical protein